MRDVQDDMKTKPQAAAPVTVSERILSLDILRGFAVLGILIMNIQSYSMIGAAYLNPTAYGDLTGVNRWVWILSHVFADMKFMGLFSLLFGAGIVLFTQRAEAKGHDPMRLHYRRTFWLLVFGLLHAYLLWYGDILVSYALCALGVYFFRKHSPKTLLIIGLILVSIGSLLYILFGLSLPFWPDQAIKGNLAYWRPGEAEAAAELAAYRGSWLAQMAYRAPAALIFQTFIFLIHTSWRAGGLMLIGMALYKWRILSARRSHEFYRNLILIGFGLGLPIISVGLLRHFQADWGFKYSMYHGSQFNYWGSLFISMGYVGLLMLLCQHELLDKLKHALAAAGRMAFTNYILQSFICTLLFYGHGFGLYGQIDRWGQILIVMGIWIVQLVLSPLWLKYFRFGPLEWAWRTLTYGEIQRFRVSR